MPRNPFVTKANIKIANKKPGTLNDAVDKMKCRIITTEISGNLDKIKKHEVITGQI